MNTLNMVVDYRAKGWACSLLLHGALCILATLFVASLQPRYQGAFRWDVAIVDSMQNGPSHPAIAKPQSHPAEPVQRTPASPKKVASPSSSTGTPPRESQAVASDSPALPDPTPVSPPIPEPTQESSVASTEATLQDTPPISSSRAESPRTDTAEGIASASVETPAVQTSGAALTARPDYGWLTQTLWQRIEELKRYPTRARMNRWQGTVVVRAVINEDGSFGALVMEKSSGHEDLDQDALRLLQQAGPLPMQQALGKAHLTIRIPISYTLY